MAASDSHNDNGETIFPRARAEDSNANVGIPTARQSNSDRRASTKETRFSDTDPARRRSIQL
jgi:hypothetical protein